MKLEFFDPWKLGPQIFLKIFLKHFRITAECNRVQNFEHVPPLHGSWKELDFRVTDILGTFKVYFHPYVPPNCFILFFENMDLLFEGQIMDQFHQTYIIFVDATT